MLDVDKVSSFNCGGDKSLRIFNKRFEKIYPRWGMIGNSYCEIEW